MPPTLESDEPERTLSEVDDDDTIEDLVFRCLDEPDPEAELRQLTAQHSPALQDRALRVLRQVREDELAVERGDDATVPHSVAGCRILRELASGGMGTVYLAEQREPVRRRVALKVIRRDKIDEVLLRRFELERQVLALLNHEHIAKIFDAGTTASGEPYFLMEYVAGRPIDAYCDRRRLATRARLELFGKVCAAVQHAHQRGIIHRDLKSANILVMDGNGGPVPKIIDFGLARPSRPLTADTLHTQHGALVGTPAYMSPEQAELPSAEIDTRTDVYSLGVVLYELLTGSLPMSQHELSGNVAEIQRKITESRIERPSARVSSLGASSSEVAAKRRSSTAALTRELRSDLDWIVMKAIERDRNRRYATANELAADVRRYLDGEPILAGPPDLVYRVRKFIRRHRGRVAAAAMVATALVTGTIVSTVLFLDARANAREAERQQAAAEASSRRANENLRRFNLLRYRVELDDAVTEADALYPAWPDRASSMRAWLETYGERLREARPTVDAALDQLANDGPSGVGETPGDQSSESTERFLAGTLSRLGEDLATFLDPESGVLADVERRLKWAETIAARTIDSYRDRWERARRAIASADGQSASARYRSGPPLDLLPQIGLVPLGADPGSGLWEFYHPRSAADPTVVPARGPNGAIDIDGGTGIIFVLVPGGTFHMGLQRTDEDGVNYDSDASDWEIPTREISVGPFFIAKYELTQGQWTRLTRDPNPSAYPVGFRGRGMRVRVTDAHPVENVRNGDAAAVLARHGLMLPSERQWAFACRAGTTTPWSSGATGDKLAGFANVHDLTASRVLPQWGASEELDDGHVIHAPVGSFAPNAFGIHDVHGNVWEWCRHGEGDPYRCARGGSFRCTADYTRSGRRLQEVPEHSAFDIGVRAARRISPR